MRYQHVCLESLGYTLPSEILTSDEIERRLAPLYPNTIVIDRDRKEFHDRTGLVEIIRAAGLPAFHEIPYRRE